MENFTEYIGPDEDNDFTISENQITVDTMEGPVVSYKKKDFGANYFEDFEFHVQVNLTALVELGVMGVWAVTNESNTVWDCRINNEGITLEFSYSDYGECELTLYDNKNLDAYDQNKYLELNTDYYLTVKRVGSVVTCKIYSDSDRTILVDTLEVDSGYSTAYRYLFGILSFGYFASEGYFTSGYIKDLEIISSLLPIYDNPTKRSYALNSQDMILVVGGIDGYAPYISSAPAVLGMLAANAVAHNLTRDTVVASSLEKKWTSSELETLLDAGCIVIHYNKAGYHIVKGINTLQANIQSWNEDDSTTYLPMQRAIVDYVDKTLREGIDANFIGADGMTEEKLRVYAFNTFETLAKVEPQLFSEYRIESIERSGTEGWEVKWAIIPVFETNYIGITTQVIVKH